MIEVLMQVPKDKDNHIMAKGLELVEHDD